MATYMIHPPGSLDGGNLNDCPDFVIDDDKTVAAKSFKSII